MRHGHIVLGQQRQIHLVEPHRVGRQHPALENPLGGQQGRCAHAVAFLHHLAFGRGLGQVDLQQRIARPRLGRDGPQPFRRHRVDRVRSETHRQKLVPCRGIDHGAGSGQQCFPGVPGPASGTSKMAGVYTARMPAWRMASTTAAGCRYCSQVVVTPLQRSSAAPSAMPQYTSSSSSRASRGQTDSCNHRSSGSPSPALRRSVMGECP